MKTIILAALIAVSAVATGGTVASADTFAVHVHSTHYGR